MQRQQRRSTAAIATLAFGALLAGAASWVVPATAKTRPDPAGTSKPADATTAPAFPTFVQLPADQAVHPSVDSEWWYVVGHLNAGGHRFGYEVMIGAGPAPYALIAITDKTTGAYYPQSQIYSPDQTSFSTTALDVRTPSATLSGPMDAMRLHARLPVGEINLTLSARGPVLYNNGTGLIPFLGGTSYYYSLPSLVSQGTLTVNSRTYRVTGQSWLDRQWGTWDWSTVEKWTWMPLQLSNGDRVNLWDVLFAQGGEFHYATVLRPDGTHEIVAVEPLADTTSGFWTSPTTGKRYGTRWIVNIPALDARLTVVAQPQGQEIQAGEELGGVYEGAASVTGRYRGKPVTGQAYVEQLGDWR
jgi:predicted secreted hydrolase